MDITITDQDNKAFHCQVKHQWLDLTIKNCTYDLHLTDVLAKVGLDLVVDLDLTMRLLFNINTENYLGSVILEELEAYSSQGINGFDAAEHEVAIGGQFIIDAEDALAEDPAGNYLPSNFERTIVIHDVIGHEVDWNEL